MKKLVFLFSLIATLFLNVSITSAAVHDEWVYFFSAKAGNDIQIDCYCDVNNAQLDEKNNTISVWTANVLSKTDASGVKTFLMRYSFNPKTNMVRELGSIDLDEKDQVLHKNTEPTEWMKIPPKSPAAEVLRILQEKSKKK